MSAEAEAKSYLRQKYQLDQEFTETLLYSYSKVYYTFQRFYVNGDAYYAPNSYNVGDLVTYRDITTNNPLLVYQCIQAVPSNIVPTNAAYWALLGAPYSIYSVQTYSGGVVLPFEYSKAYLLGDKVYWKGKIYTCRVPTAAITHDVALQYGFYQNIPQNNVAPDDTVNGLQYWGVGVAYSVPSGTLIKSNYFVADDNRDAQMVMMIIDVALFHLHSRIAPRNIPELRVKRYEAAVDWFHMCAEGKITPALPLIQPKQGNRIRFGGNVKNINNY
jgi:hypothetical protein